MAGNQIYRFAQDRPDFAEALETARKVGATAHADELVSEALELMARAEAGKAKPQEIGAFRELSATLRWMLTRWDPSRYGEKPKPAVAIQINTTLALDEASHPEGDGSGYVVTVDPQGD